MTGSKYSSKIVHPFCLASLIVVVQQLSLLRQEWIRESKQQHAKSIVLCMLCTTYVTAARNLCGWYKVLCIWWSVPDQQLQTTSI